MSKRNRIIFAATVATCTFCGQISICMSDEVKNSTKAEAFAIHFDKAYEALIERLKATPRGRGKFGGAVSVNQIDYREMLNEAKSLAEHADLGAHLYLKSEVEDQLDKGQKFGERMPRFQLALLAFAKLESGDARETLRHFLSRENPFLGAQTVIVISYLPRQQAKKLLEQILEAPDRIAEPYALESAVSLLAAIGDNKSMTVLKSLEGKEKRLPCDFLTKQVKTMQYRLAIKSERERCERTKHELLYWQAQHDQVSYRLIRARYFVAARTLRERKLALPVDLLLSKLPDPTAIAILSVQKEKAAIPKLKKLATRDGMIGLMAKEALELIRNPETPK